MKTVEDALGAVLSGTISAITQRSIFNRLGGMARVPVADLGTAERQTILKELESSLRLFARGGGGDLLAACKRALDPRAQPEPAAEPAAPSKALHKVFAVELEKDIASARLEAWSEAVRIGLSKFTAVKVATAVSELARNIVFYAGQGTVELSFTEDERGPTLQIVAKDQGPGIDSGTLDEIWAGTYKSPRGMGKGLVAVKKLVTDFHLDTAPGKGTTVTCIFRGDR